MMPESVRILLCGESPLRAAALVETLAQCGYREVHRRERTQSMMDAVQTCEPDVILIDVESPRRDMLEQLALIRDRHPRPVVMFAQDTRMNSVQSAIDSGVSAYVTSAIGVEQVAAAVEVAVATFRKLEKLNAELFRLRTDLSNRKTIHEAKLALMKMKNLSEDDAYHFMRKFAMNRKKKIADVATDVLQLTRLQAN